MNEFDASDIFGNSFQMNSINISQVNNDQQEQKEHSLDEKIYKLQDQIDIVNEELEKTLKNLNEKPIYYSKELDKISNTILEAQNFADEQLEIQQEEFDKELNLTKKQHDGEIEECRANMNGYLKENEKMFDTRKELIYLGEKTKEVDLERKMNANQNEYLEKIENDQRVNDQKMILQKVKTSEYTNQINLLSKEILSIQSSRRAIENEQRLQMNELMERINMSVKDHEMNLNKMKKEMEDRNYHFDQHVISLRSMVDKEKCKFELDIQLIDKKFQNMKEIYKMTIKRGNSQLHCLKTDMETQQRSIDNASKNEIEFKNKSREQLVRTQNLHKELKQHYEINQHIQNEIMKLGYENQVSMNELQKYSVQSSRNSNYTSKRSIFKH
ncbi:hypothetical protein TRFO_33631 [Tritrichomonas foetus]|uniref:Uncharacterized protein n=1 Tax=Tritrichomonas foetus TaxID=1144522 RepID=A0A1J4JL47_9EUKA|nr:hypothetical protein TRFO_33631 [Tritrichomonas foetus]|eukprot:OHS99810.1 hypothetical protein TRFO_33631 [Tritrichomonas foetus]